MYRSKILNRIKLDYFLKFVVTNWILKWLSMEWWCWLNEKKLILIDYRLNTTACYWSIVDKRGRENWWGVEKSEMRPPEPAEHACNSSCATAALGSFNVKSKGWLHDQARIKRSKAEQGRSLQNAPSLPHSHVSWRSCLFQPLFSRPTCPPPLSLKVLATFKILFTLILISLLGRMLKHRCFYLTKDEAFIQRSI
jgi:hypothetical protein